MDKVLKLDALTMGVCYYPEHWNRELWESDLERMLASGIRVVRIAEFAWSIFEPEEGRFTFELFDSFLALAEKKGMKVIIGTPTATPPAWAAENYPEILNATKEGILYRHGSRRHYNYNSRKYRELTAAIVEKLANQYGHNGQVIGWQIDNEMNCQLDEFYSDADTIAFRQFLKSKYGTLEKLNEAWGTVFWNQTYSDWNQIYVPRKTSEDATNPHELLDYIRFVSDSLCRFAALQSNILRTRISKNQFITTNGIFDNVDNHRLTRESLDFMTYDSYPNFAFALDADPKHSDNLNDRKWSKYLSEVRSISPNFGVMEQQTGAGGWTNRMEAPMPKPGQMSLWSFQSVAHGADYVSFFRWRTSIMGTEIYWHGILDYNNRNNRRLAELRTLHDKFEKIRGIAGARYSAAFAVVKEYDNIFDTRYDVWHRRVERESDKGWFNAAQLTHTPMDYFFICKDTTLEMLQRYPLLVYPHATILKHETAALLKAYVEAGGTLIFGCRTGYKDETGKCVMGNMTGAASEICGVDLSDYTFLGPNDGRVGVEWGERTIDTAVFNDVLMPLQDSVEILGRYNADFYKGAPALTVNRIGKGKAYYFGSAFTEKTAAAFLKELGAASPLSSIIEAPVSCELAVRSKKNEKFLFVLNFSGEPAEIYFKKSVHNLLDGDDVTGCLTLDGFGSGVFQI